MLFLEFQAVALPDIAFTVPLTIKVNMFLFNGTAAQCTPFIGLVSVGFAC